jgi:hypothetical protein
MREAVVIADLYLTAQGDGKGVTKSGIGMPFICLTPTGRHPPKV